MVMQSKIESNHTYLEDNKKLPFQLVLLIGFEKREVPVTHLTTNPQKILDNMYEIEELVDLGIKVKTNEQEPIHINWGNVTDKEEDTNISFVLDEQQQVYSLFSNEKSIEGYPWRCGTYHFEVKYKNQIYYGGFKITPKNVDEQQLNNIHEFIHSHLEGLAIDYINYKKTFSDLSTLENSSHWQFIQWYQKIEQKLHQSLNMIENNSQRELKKLYLIENEPKHIDSRSVRWENTAKGQALKGNGYLNRKLMLDSNSDSNRLVKFRLRLFVNKIENTLDSVNELRGKMENQLKKVKEAVKGTEDQLNKIQLNSRVTTRNKLEIEKALNSRKKEQEEVEKNVAHVKKVQQDLARSKKLLYSRLSSTFWFKIGDRPPKHLQLEKYAGYQVFQQIWDQYDHSTSKNKKKVFKLPVYRPTYELYEYYILLSVLNILEELGFKTQKDSVREQLMSTFFENGLLDSTKVTLQKEKIRIDVIYEEMVAHDERAALKNETHFFNLNKNHRKPDIRIDLYSQTMDEWKYDSSFIIEVKYRPFRNIFNEYGNTKAMEQMVDYWSIVYVYSKEQKKMYKRNAIEHVICVYPGDKNAEIRQNTAPGIFLQYYPRKKSDDPHDIVGKSELKQLINSWLEEKK